MLAGAEGGEARHRRRRPRAGRLPRALARVGRRRAGRRRAPSPVRRSTGRRWDDAIARARAIVAGRTRNASPGARAGRRAARPGARRRRRRRLHRRHGGRGRRAGRPADERRAAGLALLVRPGAQAGQAAGRGAGQVAGPEGHQGRRRRRRPHGVAAGAAVRPAARGARSSSPTSTRRASTRASATCTRELDKLAARGPAAARTALNRLKGLVTGSLSKDVFADADLVIEAVFEEMSVKQQVFAEVEAVVSAECVLATNTSALSITEMAVEARAPGAGRRAALLQPGGGAAAARGRARRADRRRGAGHRVRRRQGAEEELRARRRRPGVRGQPAAHPLPRRGHLGRGAGHPGGRGRPGAGPAGPADDARSSCSRWSGRRWRCTWPSGCTRRSPTGSPSARGCGRWSSWQVVGLQRARRRRPRARRHRCRRTPR